MNEYKYTYRVKDLKLDDIKKGLLDFFKERKESNRDIVLITGQAGYELINNAIQDLNSSYNENRDIVGTLGDNWVSTPIDDITE